MQVSYTLKQVETQNEHVHSRGWIVTFAIEVRGAPDFDIPVLVKFDEAEEKTLVEVAYQRLHEVVSELEKRLASAP